MRSGVLSTLAVAALLCLVGSVSAQRLINVGVNVDPTNPGGNPSASAVVALNATAVRIEYKDGTAGPTPDPNQLQLYTGVISAYAAAGIRTLLIVDYSTLPNAPSPDDPFSTWQPWVDSWAMRVAKLAASFSSSGVMAFEIWNEPDGVNTPGYHPYVNPSTYAYMLAVAAGNISAAAPNIKVILGGLSSGNPSYVSQVMQASSGGTLPCDAVGLHPYGQRPTPNWPSSTWGFGVVGTLVDNYLAVWSSVQPTLPIWITEDGDSDTTTQDDFPFHLFTALNNQTMAEHVPWTFWFCWSDAMVSPFGLVDTNQNPKPSYYSYGEFAGLPFSGL